jgi:TonB family protein
LFVLSPLLAFGQFREKSAGASIEQATHEAAAKQANPQTAEKTDSPTNVKVLTDTKGFHVEAYLDNVMPRVRDSWYAAIHQRVDKPDQRNGTVTVGFTVVRSGEIQDVHVVHGSGEQDLDDAARQGVATAGPLPPLPKALPPDELKLTIHFMYKGLKPSKWWRRR